MQKTILITGSSDGIGKLAAIQLAQDGHQVYLHGRNQDKLNEAVEEARQKSGNNTITGYLADFSDLANVRKMADQVNSDLDHIDVLINNAGILKSKTAKNAAGIDIRFEVNYLAPYVLTNNLQTLLDKGTKSRLINVASAAQAPVNLAALRGDTNLTDQESYAQSKLALVMWTFDYAKNHPSIVSIAVNPGSLLDTKMANEAYGRHWAPASKGANILVDLATSDEYNNESGKYFDNDKGTEKGYFAPAQQDAYDQQKINQLIEETNHLVSEWNT